MDTAIRRRTAFTIGAFSVDGAPDEAVDPIIRLSSDELTALVGYGEHDSDAQNPLEDCDGLGTIHHHPRSKYGRRDDDGYIDALGLCSNGEPDLENSKVVARVEAKLRAAVEAADLSDIVKILADAEDEDIHYDADQVRELLLGDLRDIERWSDISDAAHSMCWELWSTSMWPDELRDAVDAVLPNELDWSAEHLAALEAGEIGDPDAVLLDRYEHGLCQYSVHSGRRDWDLSGGEAVWVPGDYVREEILRRAAVYAHGEIVERGYKTTRRYAAIVSQHSDKGCRDDGGEIGEFEHWHLAFAALQQHVAAFETAPEALAAGRARAAAELAGQACDVYTEWCNGNCYGIVVELHRRTDEEAEWEFVEQLDSCRGYYGSDDAEGQLADTVVGLEDRLHG